MAAATVPLSIETVMLERLRFGAKVHLPQYVAASLEVDVYTEHMLQDLVARLRAEVLAHKQIDETVSDTATLSVTASVDMPASTWQMFKHRHESSWWLGWVVRRRPVRSSTVSKTETKIATLSATWKGYANFPDASVRYPDNLGAPVFVSYVDRDTYYRDAL